MSLSRQTTQKTLYTAVALMFFPTSGLIMSRTTLDKYERQARTTCHLCNFCIHLTEKPYDSSLA